MSKELRNDADIGSKIEELEKASRLYLAFDMQRFQSDMNKELEGQIGKLKQEYNSYHDQVNSRLRNCEELNKKSLTYKNDSVSLRL